MKTLQYRSASNGYWVGLLFPIALYLTWYRSSRYYYKNNAHQSYADKIPISLLKWPQVLTEPAIILLLIIIKNTLILTVIHKFYSTLEYNSIHFVLKVYNSVVLSAIVVYTLVFSGYIHLYGPFTYSAINFMFPYTFYHLVLYYPKSFTFGEAIAITQGFCAAFWIAATNVPLPQVGFSTIGEEALIILLSQVGLLAVVLISRLLVVYKRPWSFVFMEEFLCIWAKSCLVVKAFRLVPKDLQYFVTWMFAFFVETRIRAALFVYWTLLFITALGFVTWYNRSGRQTTTKDRKFFHFLIVAVFLPGIILDYNLLYLSTMALIDIFILVELTRYLDLKILGLGLGKAVDEYMGQFRDKQDEGRLIITHIYLLCGCSIPLWLHGLHLPYDTAGWDLLGILSGVLSVGIGDTFASLGGSKFGTTRWLGNGKSVEGTICSIISQTVVLFLLNLSGLCSMSLTVQICGLIAIVINSLVETKTDQIDNFILPLVTFNTIYALKCCVLYFGLT